MTIHHATLKKAKAAGVVISEPEHGYFTVLKDGTLLAEGGKANDVLAAALSTLAPVKAPKQPKAAKSTKKAKKRKAKKADDEEEDEDGEEGSGSKSVITAKYKKKYRLHKDTNGDEMAEALRNYFYPDGEEFDKGRFYGLAKAHGIDGHKWDNLKNRTGAWNVGMARMDLRNTLQGLRRHGQTVTIGNTKFGPINKA